MLEIKPEALLGDLEGVASILDPIGILFGSFLVPSIPKCSNVSKVTPRGPRALGLGSVWAIRLAPSTAPSMAPRQSFGLCGGPAER